MKDISIIIVNWKVCELLRICLNSLYDHSIKNSFELIVIDNDSRDGSDEMVKSEFPNAIFIANTNNIGLYKAINQGIKISSGKYILLLNPDVILNKNTVNVLADFLDTHPQTGAVSCKELRPDGTFVYKSRRRNIVPWVEISFLFGLKRLNRIPIFKHFFPDEYMRNEPIDKLCKVDILAAACMMIRKQVFNKLGMFDETFWLMSGDVDISMRMGRSGWDIYYLPDSSFIHNHQESVKKSDKNVQMIIIGERFALFKKFWGESTAQIYRLAVFFSSWFYMLIGILSILNYKAMTRRFKLGIKMFFWSIKPYITPR